MIVPFPEFTPDQHDIANGSQVISNVIPGETSYRPAHDISVVSSNAADARITGMIALDDQAGTNYIFAGNATKLYQLVSSTSALTDKSKVGGYSTATGERWTFTTFGSTILASNYSDVIQSWQIGTSTAWADLAGTPPQARSLATVRDFVVCGDIIESSTAYNNRVRWSAIGDETNWTIGTSTQSDYQDFFEGGSVQAVVGGEFGLVFLKRGIYRMDYVGAPLIFQVDQIASNKGLAARDAFVRVGNTTFFLDRDGFYSYDGRQITSIGFGKVDRYFWEDVDVTLLDRVTCASDPINQVVCWSYPSKDRSDQTSSDPNRVIVYNYRVGRWSRFDAAHQLIRPILTTDYTLEELDTISASLDAMTTSLDSHIYQGGELILAAATTDHKIGAFTGDTLAVTIDTPEAALADTRRSLIRGIRPIVDGGTLSVQIASRNRFNDAFEFGTASSQNTNGMCPLRAEGRYHRARLNIAAGGSWDHAVGLEYDFVPSGAR